MSGHLAATAVRASLVGIIVVASCAATSAQSSRRAVPRSEPSQAEFREAMDQRVAEARTRIREIAEPVLERFETLTSAAQEPDIEAQEIGVQAAEVEYQNARLVREVGEIAVKEYEEGIYLQEVARARGEILVAESDLKHSTSEIARTGKILERVKKADSGSVSDTMALVHVEAMVKAAELSKEKAKLSLEQARSQLKLLEQYEKPKRLRDLQSTVEKALSEELAKKRLLERARTELARAKVAEGRPRIPGAYEAILSRLAEAVRLHGEARDRLAKLTAQNDEPANARKEIEERTRTMDANVSEAWRLLEELKFSELSNRITSALSRSATAGAGLGLLKKLHNLAPEDRARLKTAADADRAMILRKAGFTDSEIEQIRNRLNGVPGGP